MTQEGWARLYWRGMLAVVLGTVLNLSVMFANHKKMPVYTDAATYAKYTSPSDRRHVLANADTRLGFLADWISIGIGKASPGDCLMIPGLIVLWISWFNIRRSRRGSDAASQRS